MGKSVKQQDVKTILNKSNNKKLNPLLQFFLPNPVRISQIRLSIFYYITNMKIRLNILFISLLIGFAYPCSCMEPLPPQEAYEEADAVFSGQVTNIVVDENGYYHEVTFQIIDVWKGEDSEEITVLTETYSNACGYNLSLIHI